MTSKTIYITRLSLIDTAPYCLEALKDLVAYPGSIQAFRMLCWRYKIPFEKGYRGTNKKLNKLITEGFDFSHLTLPEIKRLLSYDGGLDGLLTFLQRHKIDFNHEKSFTQAPTKEAIMEAIKELGKTSHLSPKQIVRAIGFDIVNPSQFLTRNKIPYKRRKPS